MSLVECSHSTRPRWLFGSFHNSPPVPWSISPQLRIACPMLWPVPRPSHPSWALPAGHDFRANREPPRNQQALQRRVVASGSAKVAISLRRDEPWSATLAVIWPVDFHDAFTRIGLHGVLLAKAQRLISAERDGYFGLSRIAKSTSESSASRTCRNSRTHPLSNFINARIEEWGLYWRTND